MAAVPTLSAHHGDLKPTLGAVGPKVYIGTEGWIPTAEAAFQGHAYDVVKSLKGIHLNPDKASSSRFYSPRRHAAEPHPYSPLMPTMLSKLSSAPDPRAAKSRPCSAPAQHCRRSNKLELYHGEMQQIIDPSERGLKVAGLSTRNLSLLDPMGEGVRGKKKIDIRDSDVLGGKLGNEKLTRLDRQKVYFATTSSDLRQRLCWATSYSPAVSVKQSALEELKKWKGLRLKTPMDEVLEDLRRSQAKSRRPESAPARRPSSLPTNAEFPHAAKRVKDEVPHRRKEHAHGRKKTFREEFKVDLELAPRSCHPWRQLSQEYKTAILKTGMSEDEIARYGIRECNCNLCKAMTGGKCPLGIL